MMATLTPVEAKKLYNEQGVNIVIPDGYTVIADNAFDGYPYYYNYGDIESVAIPSTIKTIEGYAFYGNQIKSIKIPNGVESIGDGAFEGNYITKLEIPGSVKFIEEDAFRFNNIKKLKIANGIEKLNGFYANKIKKLKVPGSVVEIEEFAFYSNEISKLKISKGVETIGEQAFGGNNLTKVKLPNSVETIERYAFDPGVELIQNGKSTKIVSSVNDLRTQKKISHYLFYDQFETSNKIIKDGIAGTKKDEWVVGTSANEIIAGREGRDELTGYGGMDAFLLEGNFGFGSKFADTITDFENDRLLISKKDFGIKTKPYKTLLNTVKPEDKLKFSATKTEHNFVYNEVTGQLYFNENGTDDGWGQGGLIANLEGAPKIDEDNFVLLVQNGQSIFEKGGGGYGYDDYYY